MLLYPTIAVGCYAGAATLLASYAMYEWYKAKQKLKEFTQQYESDIEVQRSLINQYCTLDSFPILKDIIPEKCEGFHERVASMCIDLCEKYSVWKKRALDVGSGTGAISFMLKRYFSEVIATDTSVAMNVTCQQLKEHREMYGFFPSEGSVNKKPFRAALPNGAEENITIWDEDACTLVYTCGKFDCIVVVNTLSELHDPVSFLKHVGDYAHPKGLLVIADCYNWPENCPVADVEGTTSSEKIDKVLGDQWVQLEQQDIPFFTGQTDRSAQIGVAELTVWQRVAT